MAVLLLSAVIGLFASGAISFSSHPKGTQVFVSQSGAGNGSGEGGCGDAHSLSWLRQEGNWGSGSGKVGPGVTVDLCGTFTEPVETRGGGSSGRPVTIRFMSGAKIAMGGSGCPGSGCINVANKSEWVTIDGGSHGVVESTNRGTRKERSEAPTTGVMANGCKHCVIENLEVANLYVAERGDTVGNTEIRGIVVRPEGSTPEYITIRNDVFHDMGWAVNVEAAQDTSHIYVEHNLFYHLTHGFTPGASFSGGDVGTVVFAHNRFYGNINWEDGEADTNHVDGVHCFAGDGQEPHYNGLYIYDNYIKTEGHNVTGPIFMEGSDGNTPCADRTSQIWIFNNVLTGTTCCGLAGDFSGEPHILDNTLIGASANEGPCQVLNSDASVKLVVQNVRFKNNVVTTCHTLMDAERQLIAPGGISNNLWAGAAGSSEAFVCRNPEKDYSIGEYAAWRACVGAGETGAVVTGGAKLDLRAGAGRLGRPEDGSRAIAHGANLTSLCSQTPGRALCRNIIGQSRPARGAWNIGAY